VPGIKRPAVPVDGTAKSVDRITWPDFIAVSARRPPDAVVALAEPVESHFLWRPSLRDPADEMVLETAVGGRASAIVTFNVRDFGVAPGRFGIEVLRPVEALRRIRR